MDLAIAGEGGEAEWRCAERFPEARPPWEACDICHRMIFAEVSKDRDTHFTDEETKVQR